MPEEESAAVPRTARKTIVRTGFPYRTAADPRPRLTREREQPDRNNPDAVSPGPLSKKVARLRSVTRVRRERRPFDDAEVQSKRGSFRNDSESRAPGSSQTRCAPPESATRTGEPKRSIARGHFENSSRGGCREARRIDRVHENGVRAS